MSDTYDVLPCPFCGNEPEFYMNKQYSDCFIVECDNCGVKFTSEYGYDFAVKQWNTRHTTGEKKEPFAYIFMHPLGENFYHRVDASCAGKRGVVPVFRHLEEE